MILPKRNNQRNEIKEKAFLTVNLSLSFVGKLSALEPQLE